MDKYLQTQPLKVISAYQYIDDINELCTQITYDEYCKSALDVHNQCYINNLPLNYDVICLIKDFLYIDGNEVKTKQYKLYLKLCFYHMIIGDTEYSNRDTHIEEYTLKEKEIEGNQFACIMCNTCGNYKQLQSISRYAICVCEQPLPHMVYVSKYLEDNRNTRL
jgi:hypothetical protein